MVEAVGRIPFGVQVEAAQPQAQAVSGTAEGISHGREHVNFGLPYQGKWTLEGGDVINAAMMPVDSHIDARGRTLVNLDTGEPVQGSAHFEGQYGGPITCLAGTISYDLEIELYNQMHNPVKKE